jgi:hypothetical protein
MARTMHNDIRRMFEIRQGQRKGRTEEKDDSGLYDMR